LRTFVNQLTLHGPVSISELKKHADGIPKDIFDAIKSESGISKIDIDELVATGQHQNLVQIEKSNPDGAGRPKTVVMALPCQN